MRKAEKSLIGRLKEHPIIVAIMIAGGLVSIVRTDACSTTRRRWVSERLGMGDESRVTQAIGRVKRDGPRELKRLKRRLEQVYESINGETEI